MEDNPGKAKRAERREERAAHARHGYLSLERRLYRQRLHKEGPKHQIGDESFYKAMHDHKHRKQNPEIIAKAVAVPGEVAGTVNKVAIEVPGVSWLEDHWIEVGAGAGLALGAIFAIHHFRKQSSGGCSCGCGGGPGCAEHAQGPIASAVQAVTGLAPAVAGTAQTAVDTDRSQYDAAIGRGGQKGPLPLFGPAQSVACSNGRLDVQGLCWHPRNAGAGWFAHNPQNSNSPAGVGIRADSGLRFMSAGQPQWA